MFKLTRNRQMDLAVLSGLLFVPGWFTWGSGVTMFFAFIPLLLIEEHLHQTKGKVLRVFGLSLLSFFVFNLLAVWWLKGVTYLSLFVAIAITSFLMAISILLFTITRRILGDFLGYLSFVAYWLGYEFIYLNGEISFPWLNLGNGFANDIKIIQWYEYTGTLGGTLWVLLVNLFLFLLIKKFLASKKVSYPGLFLTLAIIFAPILYSIRIFNNYKEIERPYEIVIAQPNIDPYYKYLKIPPEEQVEILLRLADSLTTPSTDYVLGPETFLNYDMIYSQRQKNPGVLSIKNFVETYPKVKFVIGSILFKAKEGIGEIPKLSANELWKSDEYISYNSALQIDTTDNIQDYYKSKLVLGGEKLPYYGKAELLNKLMIKLGGVLRYHETQPHREVLKSPQDSVSIGTIICYESVYGEFVTEYVKEGANLLFVLSNDGWWGDTPGYKQHKSYSSLRAIETRRSIARSANTGISCFINQRGEVIKQIDWWECSAIKEHLNANDINTFYVLNGDYIGKISLFISSLLLVLILTVRFKILKKMELKV